MQYFLCILWSLKCDKPIPRGEITREREWERKTGKKEKIFIKFNVIKSYILKQLEWAYLFETPARSITIFTSFTVPYWEKNHLSSLSLVWTQTQVSHSVTKTHFCIANISDFTVRSKLYSELDITVHTLTLASIPPTKMRFGMTVPKREVWLRALVSSWGVGLTEGELVWV